MKTSKLKKLFDLSEAFGYFWRVFAKKDPTKKVNTNLKIMHGINKISILLFLVALFVMVYRALMRG